MKTLNLAGDWILKNCNDGKKYNAMIPGSDFGNLIRNGAIKNPLISGDEKEGIKTGENEYEFSKSFKLIASDLDYKHINLAVGGLDTLCKVYINGKKAFESCNAYIPVDRDIKEFLVEGENTLLFHFDSAVKYITKLQKENPLPKNSNGIDGIPYIRKPGCHFGWDWGPCVPYSAIVERIELKLFNNRIENIKIKQNTTEKKSVITANADGAEKIYIIAPDKNIITFNEHNEAVIENPQLWYTRELSGLDEQPLYTVVFENEEDKVEKKIGLRSIYLDRSDDEYGSNFCFVLNGEKIFSKGANLIPFSAIYEDSDNSTIDYYLDMAQASNFNMLRIWGGGSYASDYLLEQCDKRGILIWQDFCFACQMYPFYDEKFTENVLNEVKVNVERLTTHPSLALWCGNNEIETMFSFLPKTLKIVKAYEEFFYHTLPDFIEELTDISYIPSSPIGKSCFKDCSSDDYGDTHMWNVWHGLKKLDYYTTRYSRFLSEFGLESLPSMKSIKTFAKEKDYDINSEAFNRHQKCVGGNPKMLFYLTEMFSFPKKFEDLPYLTGIVQAECIKNATVHFRQNKGRCNGSIFWQFNDVWNCPSWSSVDFEGIPKALQYKAREFFAPITVSCKKEKGKAVVYAHNDTLKDTSFELTVKTYNPDSVKKYNVNIKSNSYCVVDEIKVNKTTIMQLCFNDEVITEIFNSPSKLRLKKVNITHELNGNELTITSDGLAYNLFIESDVPCDRNYFSLAKGEKTVVRFPKKPESFRITCANNIEFKNNPVKKMLFRFFYRLKPMNIANYFYYSTN